MEFHEILQHIVSIANERLAVNPDVFDYFNPVGCLLFETFLITF